MRGWTLSVVGGLFIVASLTGAQTPNSSENTKWQATAIDPGYSVGWFDCVWRDDTLYVATRERFGYYLKLFSYYDGRLTEAGVPSRYDDSVLWKQGFYSYDLLDDNLDLVAANDTAILWYDLAGNGENRKAVSRYSAGKFAKARVEAIAGYPRNDGVYMVFRGGDYKKVLDIDNNPRFYGKYFLIAVDSLKASETKTFGKGRRDCDFFHGILTGDTLCAVYREREAGPWYAPNRKHTEQTLFLKYHDGNWSEPTVVSTEEQFPGVFSWPAGFYRANGEFYLITVSVSEGKKMRQALYWQSSGDGVTWSTPELAVASVQNFAAGGVASSGNIHLLTHDPADGRLIHHVVFDGSEWFDNGVVFSADESGFRFEQGPGGSLYLFYAVGDVDQRTIRFVRVE